VCCQQLGMEITFKQSERFPVWSDIMYLIPCCWVRYHRTHRKLILFAEYFGINLEDAVTHKTEEVLAVIVFRDLLVCIPAKIKLEKYSESILYVLHWHIAICYFVWSSVYV
jgi:hypothetical protein